MNVGIVGPGYLGISSNINASRCINFYPVINSGDSKSVTALIGTPGLAVFSDQLSGPIRGMHVFNGLIYFVSGNRLYSINNAGVMSNQLGSDLALNTGRVVMADNGLSPTGANELAIADGENIYIYNISTTNMTTLNINAKTIAFLNGYFVADIGGMQWQCSNLYDGTTWDNLNKSTADGASDDVLAVINNHGELWLFGEYTTEIWYLTGSASPLFSRVSGGVLDYGCAARYSIAKGANTVFWLATQKIGSGGEFVGVVMADGYSIKPISTDPINQTIGKYSTISDAVGFCFNHSGHTFYVLTFPSQNSTFVYDITTNFWHEWASYTDGLFKVGRHRSNCYVFYLGKHYVGDYASGKIFELSAEYYDDAGDPIVSTRITEHLSDKEDLNNLYISKLKIDLESGNSLKEKKFFWDVLKANLATTTFDSVNVGGYIYLTDYTNGKVIKLNGENLEVVKTITVGSSPVFLTSAFGYLWVSNNASNNITKISLTTDTVTATIAVGVNPRRCVATGSYVYVPNTGSGNVSKINPYTDVVTTIIMSHVDAPKTIRWDGSYYLYVSNLYSPMYIDVINVLNDSIVFSETYDLVIRDFVLSDDGYLYTFGYDGTTQGYIRKVNATTGALIDSYAVDNDINASWLENQMFINEDETYGNILWWLNATTGKIHGIKLSSFPDVFAEIIIPAGCLSMVYAFDYLWIVSNGTNVIYQYSLNYGETANPKAVYNINNNCRLIGFSDAGIYLPGATYFFEILKKEIVPKAKLSWSDDGGHTWSNFYEASTGNTGEYSKRLIWHRLGKTRGRCFKIDLSDATKKVLLAAHITATKGIN